MILSDDYIIDLLDVDNIRELAKSQLHYSKRDLLEMRKRYLYASRKEDRRIATNERNCYYRKLNAKKLQSIQIKISKKIYLTYQIIYSIKSGLLIYQYLDDKTVRVAKPGQMRQT